MQTKVAVISGCRIEREVINRGDKTWAYFWVYLPARGYVQKWLACYVLRPMDQINSQCLWNTPEEAAAMAIALQMAIEWLAEQRMEASVSAADLPEAQA